MLSEDTPPSKNKCVEAPRSPGSNPEQTYTKEVWWANMGPAAGKDIQFDLSLLSGTYW